MGLRIGSIFQNSFGIARDLVKILGLNSENSVIRIMKSFGIGIDSQCFSEYFREKILKFSDQSDCRILKF